MKTAEELHSRSVNYFDGKGNPVITLESFKEALTEHDKEIKEKIKGKILYYRSAKAASNAKQEKVMFGAIISALTQLLNFVEGEK